MFNFYSPHQSRFSVCLDFLQAGKSFQNLPIQLPGGVDLPIKIRSFTVRILKSIFKLSFVRRTQSKQKYVQVRSRL